jgi:putative selenium metabolism protein SsnA
MILRGATVIESLEPLSVLTGDVRVEHGRVIAVGGHASMPDAVRDCSGCLVIPGNVNAHTHLYSALARGMPYDLTPPSNFVEILRRVWWRLDCALDEDTVRASARAGAMEALLSGTTTLIDHHASPHAIDGSLDAIMEELEALGIRSVLCYETSDRDGVERAEAGLDENRRFLEAIRRNRPQLTRGLVGAHASFTLSDDTLDGCVQIARDLDTGVHIHVAEDAADEEDALARYGIRVVKRLAHAGALDERTLLAHCVHLSDKEIALVRAANPTIAHNARSNMNNSIGRARVGLLGPHVALGTDGIGSDLFEESRTAYFRLRENDDTAGAGWPLARLAAGAHLAGRVFGEPLLGTLEPGAPADLVVLDYAAPAPVDQDSFAGHWVFGLSARHVRDVMVAGEFVVTDRRLTRVDQDALAAGSRDEAERLWSRLAELGEHDFAMEGAH